MRPHSLILFLTLIALWIPRAYSTPSAETLIGDASQLSAEIDNNPSFLTSTTWRNIVDTLLAHYQGERFLSSNPSAESLALIRSQLILTLAEDSPHETNLSFISKALTLGFSSPLGNQDFLTTASRWASPNAYDPSVSGNDERTLRIQTLIRLSQRLPRQPAAQMQLAILLGTEDKHVRSAIALMFLQLHMAGVDIPPEVVVRIQQSTRHPGAPIRRALARELICSTTITSVSF